MPGADIPPLSGSRVSPSGGRSSGFTTLSLLCSPSLNCFWPLAEDQKQNYIVKPAMSSWMLRRLVNQVRLFPFLISTDVAHPENGQLPNHPPLVTASTSCNSPACLIDQAAAIWLACGLLQNGCDLACTRFKAPSKARASGAFVTCGPSGPSRPAGGKAMRGEWTPPVLSPVLGDSHAPDGTNVAQKHQIPGPHLLEKHF